MSVDEDRDVAPTAGAPADPEVRQILDRVREHLGMDIAFLSGLTTSAEVVLATSTETGPMQMAVGDERDLDDTYCVRVLSGLLPPVLPDARRHPVARELAATAELGIGAYLGAPLRGPDGEPVGMLCCLARGANPLLDEDALRVLGLAAALVEDRMGAFGLPHRPAVSDRVRWIRSVLAERAVRTVFQPVVHLGTGEVVAVEALSRFEPERFPTPVHAFAAAAAAGEAVELELLAAKCALARLGDLPPGVRMSINLSAEALADPRTTDLLLAHGPAVAVEVTEHTPVHDYEALTSVTNRLRAAGHQVAVDDAGAGFASLRHVLQLRPTAIKLDLALVRGCDLDPVRRALIRAVAEFARGIDSWLVAEGVETEHERATLRELGVDYGQGYLLGRPAPLADALRGVPRG
ncbi:EAL domain-containing protein [Cellulomonas sp. PS-H5]|uniref:sensor domain-containing phosphodiesterase n=1 Tax=Cellulomonas sp. PS-H5 TaxID=2820400 RepID=UPI001C4F6361|nr:EAL domain-containing protein [Cellulomonas sp. PS-H5]MBW0255104.1 EAL domain-containing protein [Cellulomonas sp. PS-H5]